MTVNVPTPTEIQVTGIDRQAVGQFAAEIQEHPGNPNPISAKASDTEAKTYAAKKERKLSKEGDENMIKKKSRNGAPKLQHFTNKTKNQRHFF